MQRRLKPYKPIVLAFISALLLLLIGAWSVEAAGPDLASDDGCLSCHANKQMSVTTTKGESISLYVDKDGLEKSVHGKQINCVACHSDIEGFPHPQRTISDRRSFAIEQYTLCQKCHSVVYQKALDSVHADVLNTRNQNAPICTDCHGYHDVSKPDTPLTKVSTTCATCHKPIYDAYVSSVHGKALVEENNTDVPVCTDCHGIHNIKEARTAAFRIQSPDVCAKCHTDKELMGKYQISTDVYQTYREEFHGFTAEYYQTNFPTIWCYKAVCTDCHGVHDIKKPEDPTSSVAAGNLVKTCGKCHEGANENFTQAWTGHNPPSPERGFPIWAIQAAWLVIIPATLTGMVVHIGFDWRKARQRKKEEEREHGTY